MLPAHVLDVVVGDELALEDGLARELLPGADEQPGAGNALHLRHLGPRPGRLAG